MSLLKIEIVDYELKIINETKGYLGRITIDTFQELFYFPIEYWTVAHYLQQWEEGINRIKKGEDSALITAVYASNKEEPFIEWWVLHKEKTVVRIINEIIFPSSYRKIMGKRRITVDNCYQLIRPYVRDEMGEVSEWTLLWEDI